MSNSLADTSYYYQSGQRIFQGQNPYSGDLPFFSGPVGGWFLYVIGKIFFIEALPLVWQIINLLGVSVFFHTILVKLGIRHNIILLVAIMLLSSPVREMVVNNQVTGFVLGVAAIAIRTNLRNVHKSFIMTNSTLLYLVFELKPNLVLGFVVYFVVINRERILLILLSTVSIFIVSNLVLVDGIYLKWIDAIRSQGVANLTGYESLGLSTFIYESGFLSKENARILSLTLFLLCFALALVSASLSRNKGNLLIIPLLPIFFPYLHYLDFAITVPFIMYFIFFQSSLRFLAPIAIVILYLPRPTDGLLKNSLVFALLIAVITYDFYYYKLARKALVGVLFGATLLFSNYLIDSHANDEHQLQSFTVVRAWTIIAAVLLWLTLIKQDGNRLDDDYTKFKANCRTE